MWAFAEAAVGAGQVAVALDGRELEPSPPGFLAALGLDDPETTERLVLRFLGEVVGAAPSPPAG